MTTGQMLRNRRTRRKMALHEVAQACGLAVSTLSRYETGKLDPQIGTLTRLAEVLGCGTRDLVPPKVKP